jgi:rhodanese-related sulfurtransferase
MIAALQGCGAYGAPRSCAACAAGQGCGAPPAALFSGRIRVGLDGLNASISGPLPLLEAHARFLPTLPQLRGAAAVDFKFSPVLATRSATDGAFPVAAFSSYAVTPVAEIVTLKAPPATPADPAHAGRHAAPAEWHELLTSGAAPIVIDVRNAYESDIGCFQPAPGVTLLKPAVRRFEEMPAWVETNAARLEAAGTVAMYCAVGRALRPPVRAHPLPSLSHTHAHPHTRSSRRHGRHPLRALFRARARALPRPRRGPAVGRRAALHGGR